MDDLIACSTLNVYFDCANIIESHHDYVFFNVFKVHYLFVWSLIFLKIILNGQSFLYFILFFIFKLFCTYSTSIIFGNRTWERGLIKGCKNVDNFFSFLFCYLFQNNFCIILLIKLTYFFFFVFIIFLILWIWCFFTIFFLLSNNFF